MRLSLLLGAAAWLLASGASAQDQRADHDAAILAIRKLGGEVKVGEAQAGAPVRVVLAGVHSPDECLPHLARITNLHTCDL
jgi:hypothetical protein